MITVITIGVKSPAHSQAIKTDYLLGVGITLLSRPIFNFTYQFCINFVFIFVFLTCQRVSVMYLLFHFFVHTDIGIDINKVP